MKKYLFALLILLFPSIASAQTCNIVDGYQQCEIDIIQGAGITPAPDEAPSGKGRIYYDYTDDKWKCSENGADYVDFCAQGGGGGGGSTVTFQIDDSTVTSGTFTIDCQQGNGLTCDESPTDEVNISFSDIYVNTTGDTITGNLTVLGTTTGTFGQDGLKLKGGVSGVVTLNATTGAASGTVTVSAGTYDLVGDTLGQILTNKTIDGDDNTISNIGSAEITDGGVDISDDTNLVAGTGLTLQGDTMNLDSTIGSDTTGNADTATALAANGGNCSAGSYPLGVDTSGAVESCTDATTEINSAISTHASDDNAHQELVTLAGTPDYITISGQTITRNTVDISDDTNLTVNTGLVLVGDTLGVLDNYVSNTGDVMAGDYQLTGTMDIQGTLQVSGVLADGDGGCGEGEGLFMSSGVANCETPSGSGDMTKAVYDPNEDNRIDISSNTNLAVNTGLTLQGDTLFVQDIYVLTAGDTMSGNLDFIKDDPAIAFKPDGNDTDFTIGVLEDDDNSQDDYFVVSIGNTLNTPAVRIGDNGFQKRYMTIGALALQDTNAQLELQNNNGDGGYDFILNAAGDIFEDYDFIWKYAKGSLTSLATIEDGDIAGGMEWEGYDGSAYRDMVRIEVGAEGTVSGSNVPSYFQLKINTGGSSTTETLLIHPSRLWEISGKIGIGTTSTSHDLNVVGTSRVSNASIIGGNSISTSASLELSSTTKALLINRVTNADTSITSPINGMIAYDTTEDQLQGYVNGSWQSLTGGSGDITDVFSCASGDCNSVTVQSGDSLTFASGSTITAAGTMTVSGTINSAFSMGIQLVAYDTAVATGTIGMLPVPQNNKGIVTTGKNLVGGCCFVHTQGVTGSTDVTLYRRRSGSNAEMFSTDITIGAEQYACDGVVNTSNDDIQVGDILIPNVIAVHSGTAPKGLSCTWDFQ